MLPKISDFGLSRYFDENQNRNVSKTTMSGTIGYLAPELRKGVEIVHSADLYSLAVIIIEILTGQKGYQPTEDVLESWSDRLERSQRDTLCEQIRVCYEIALECRDFNPKKRPASVRDIIDRLHETESIQYCCQSNIFTDYKMELKASTARSELEQMLVDETAEPKSLPFSLLADITGGFSDDREIGHGGFAVVYKGILGNRAVAVKRLSQVYMHEMEFHREVECMMRVKHKNVVRFLGYCADRQGHMGTYNGKLIMADVHERLLCFEYIPKGSLDRYIIDANRDWRTCYKIIKGICEGLQHLHMNHIIHLDLKPSNILLDDSMVPKITDFGLSRCFVENQSQDINKTILGTMGYLAPEHREGGVIVRSADLYSLGVIIIEILTGQKGYQATENVLESWIDRLEGSQRGTLCEQIRVCYEIALECRDFNPRKRPSSAQDIINRLHEMESIQAAESKGKKSNTDDPRVFCLAPAPAIVIMQQSAGPATTNLSRITDVPRVLRALQMHHYFLSLYHMH